MRLNKPRTILSLSLFILSGVFAAAFFMGYLPSGVGAQATCTTNCYNGGTDSRWTWPQNAHVRVNISTSFSADQQREIRQAFLNWQANPNTDAGVTFEFTYDPPIGFTPGAIQVFHETPPADNGQQPVAETIPQFNSANTHLQSAIIRVHPSVTNLVALLEAMAHEIGHLYGLNDCPDCCPGTSTMTEAPFSCAVPCTNSAYYNDVTQGTSSPSTCDASNAKQAGNYNAATECPDGNGNGTCDANEPPGGGDGGGGDGGGGGGDPYCIPQYVEECGYDGSCDEWDPYTGTCTVYPGYDYCNGYWIDCP
jgi:hypothetical protein